MMADKKTHAEVERISPLTDSILQLIIKPDTYIDYQAGQYLQIMLGDEPFSYSIANAPLGSHTYELHIRHSRDNPYNQPLLDDIKNKGHVELHLPMGSCHLSRLDSNKPILFIAAGTGFAPVKAMIEQLLALGEPSPFELYWGARSQSDLYMDDKVLQWHAHVPQFQYVKHLTNANKESLADLVHKRHPDDLKDFQIVLAGPFDMVYATRDQLVTQGACKDMMYSDAFDFED
jgi:CDP-4-dehydro-6-deoxyglucose reductase, E3